MVENLKSMENRIYCGSYNYMTFRNLVFERSELTSAETTYDTVQDWTPISLPKV